MTGATGQVEREARQLVEAAARWLSAVPDDVEYAARTVDLEADAESSAGFGAAGVSEDGPLEDEGAGHAQAQEDRAREHPQGHSGEQPCRGCPWCRAKAAAGPIGADTLDSLAHLLSTAAESLTLFAQSRREASHEPAPDADTPPPGPGAGQDDLVDDAVIDDAVIDDAVIDWEDEDEDELRAGEDEQPNQSPTKQSPTRERRVR